MIHGHGGNIFGLAAQHSCHPDEIIDMSSNLNPLGPPRQLLDFLKDNLKEITRLPEVDAARIKALFANSYDLDPQNIMMGNGTTQFIYALPEVLEVKKALIVGPTYADYADSCRQKSIHIKHCTSRAQNRFHPDLDQVADQVKNCDLVFICNPNNPTGQLIEKNNLIALCQAHPDTYFVIDESYLMFVPNHKEISTLSHNINNLITLTSMSKIFAIPGLRSGFLKADRKIIDLIASKMQPWCVNSLAQSATKFLLSHPTIMDAHLEKTHSHVRGEIEKVSHKFPASLDIFPSQTSFILIRLPQNVTSSKCCRYFAKHKFLIRNCDNFSGLDNTYIRISLKHSDINDQLIQKMNIFIDSVSSEN